MELSLIELYSTMGPFAKGIVYTLAIETTDRKDEVKLTAAIHKLQPHTSCSG